jgi:hypothetical protein
LVLLVRLRVSAVWLLLLLLLLLASDAAVFARRISSSQCALQRSAADCCRCFLACQVGLQETQTHTETQQVKQPCPRMLAHVVVLQAV